MASRYFALGDTKYSAVQVYGFIGGLAALQLFTFGFFLLSIEKRFRGTFFSWKSGNENAMDFYLKGEDDEQKVGIFSQNRRKWEKIKDEVSEWVTNKIPEWNESQPEWWDDRDKASIPDWVVKDEEVLKSIRSKDVVEIKQRRKSSVVGLLENNQNGKDEEKKEDAGALRRRTYAINARMDKEEEKV